MRNAVQHKTDVSKGVDVDGRLPVDGGVEGDAAGALIEILESQSDYYKQRAPEYDEWFNREKRFDWGAEKNQLWFDETQVIHTYLQTVVEGRVVEVACGTGNYTRVLASLADNVTAVDKSPEMLALNQEKNKYFDNIDYLKQDAFEWCPEVPYDSVFLSFWLSHVPCSLMPTYLDQLAGYVRPGSRIIIVDQLREQTTTAADQPLSEEGSEIHRRLLNDGREYKIIKNFYTKTNLKSFCPEKLALTSWFETSIYFYCAVLTRVA